ncbi:MAG: adenylate/guanylate cyclase domain-containing protein [Chlamydiota bacterium]|nr:adenylate/guanylate cyclase domain-containing protein [Chlamydiota bacterium]
MLKNRQKSLIGIVLMMGFLIILLFGFSHTRLAQIWELKTLDLRFNMRGNRTADTSLLVIGIDDQSIQYLGRWPWDRSRHGALIQLLSEHPPRACGFDITFVQPSDPLEDEALVNASKLLDDLVFAAYFREQAIARTDGASTDAFLNKIALPGDASAIDSSIRAVEPEIPFAALAQVCGFAFINAPRDIDGAVRKIPLVIPYKDKLYPSFALQIILDYFDIDRKDVVIRLGKEVRFSDKSIPVDQHGNLWVNYRSAIDDFSHLNVLDVLQHGAAAHKTGKQDSVLQGLEDRIVLVGLMMTGGSDLYPTPISVETPLFLVHANVIQNILSEDYLINVTDSLQSVIFVCLLILICMLGVLLGVLAAGIASLAIFFLYAAVSYMVFYYSSVWLPLVVPSVTIITAYLFSSSYHFVVHERQRRTVKKAFQRFVSPSVLKNILDDPEALRLGGDQRNVTILFSDIRSFSSYCEKRSPEEIVLILNEYFDAMTNIVLEEGGTLDKYMGDGLMAIFGAPRGEAPENHAKKALRTALRMQQQMKSLQQKWVMEGKEPFTIGIGMHTGRVLVGNIGSRALMHYTAIGDEVNLASRVEGQTREFKKDILITHATYLLVKNFFDCEVLGEVTVKGRETPVTLYALKLDGALTIRSLGNCH